MTRFKNDEDYEELYNQGFIDYEELEEYRSQEPSRKLMRDFELMKESYTVEDFMEIDMTEEEAEKVLFGDPESFTLSYIKELLEIFGTGVGG